MSFPFLVANWNPASSAATWNRPSSGTVNTTGTPSSIDGSLFGTAFRAIPSTNTNTGNAYDGTYAGVDSSGTPASLGQNTLTINVTNYWDGAIIYSGFSGSGTTGTLYVYANSTTHDNVGLSLSEAISTVTIDYSKDGGTTWTQMAVGNGANDFTGQQSATISSGLSSQSNLMVLITCEAMYSYFSSSDKVGANASCVIYDVVFYA